MRFGVLTTAERTRGEIVHGSSACLSSVYGNMEPCAQSSMVMLHAVIPFDGARFWIRNWPRRLAGKGRQGSWQVR